MLIDFQIALVLFPSNLITMLYKQLFREFIFIHLIVNDLWVFRA